MELSHSNVEKHNPNKSINFLQEITDFNNNLHNINKCYESYEKLEKKIQEMVSKVESTLYKKSLEQYDINVKTIYVGGLPYNQVLRKKKNYQTPSGYAEVERSLYRATNGKSICPLELQAGIVEGNWTPTAARISYYVTAELTPYASEKLLKQIGHFTPSKSSLQRLSQAIGETWEATESQFSEQLYSQINIPEGTQTLSVSFDGIMLPLNKRKKMGIVFQIN